MFDVWFVLFFSLHSKASQRVCIIMVGCLHLLVLPSPCAPMYILLQRTMETSGRLPFSLPFPMAMLPVRSCCSQPEPNRTWTRCGASWSQYVRKGKHCKSTFACETAKQVGSAAGLLRLSAQKSHTSFSSNYHRECFSIPLNFSLPFPSMSGSLGMAQPAETIQNGLFESDRLKFYPITEPDFPLNTFYGLLTKRTHEPNPKNSGNVPWVLPV